ncbi:hypothetical protein E4U61_003931 [Claviceps capensis]|nr:hypothetical protein E4U61_003931 [Claviceps capensis]
MPPAHYTTLLTFTACGHKMQLSCPSCENSRSDGSKCSDANMRTIQQRIDEWPCQSCRVRWKKPPTPCTSILTYTMCGHQKYFNRPCRENFGSDGRKCSDANMHTTQQTNNKWPCQSCRELLEFRRQFRHDAAGYYSANVTLNGTGSQQGDINKDLQVESVDEST